MRRSGGTLRTLLVLAIGCWAVVAQAADRAEIERRGYLMVAVADEASPFHTLVDGKAAGFDADLLNKLRQFAPFEIREQIVPAADLAAALRDGKVDVAAISLEVTQAGQQTLDFILPVAETTLYYVKRGNDDRIRSLADLGGSKFGIRTGSSSFLQLTELEHRLAKAGGELGEAIAYDTYPDAYRDLASGRIDYVVDSIADWNAVATSQPDAFAVGLPVGHETYAAWAVAKGNADIAALLNDFFARERADGELAAVQQKWLGRSFADLPDRVTAQDWWTARDDRPKTSPSFKHEDPD